MIRLYVLCLFCLPSVGLCLTPEQEKAKDDYLKAIKTGGLQSHTFRHPNCSESFAAAIRIWESGALEGVNLPRNVAVRDNMNIPTKIPYFYMARCLAETKRPCEADPYFQKSLENKESEAIDDKGEVKRSFADFRQETADKCPTRTASPRTSLGGN